MIPQETVNKILDAAQIVDVVGDFVTLKKRGANHIACCPFHNEKTPSFSVSASKGIYKCFGCGKSGTAVGFVMEHENMSYTEALKYLAKKYHIEVVEKEETAEEIARKQRHESLLLASEYAGKFFQDSLDTPDGQVIAMQYFRKRGLEDETIRRFGLGWAPVSRRALSEAARAAGYKEEFLIDAGVCLKYDDGKLVDRFFDRVMFPVHSVSGRIIAFGGRTLRTDKSVAKYINSPESEIYVKSKSLYGIYFAKNEISRQDKCILVEGYLDVISMHQLGIRNVVASSGTSLTVEQIRLIRKFTNNITIIYDGDGAGIKAALRGIGLVLKEGMNVKVVLLPDGQDPDDFSRRNSLEEVRDYIVHASARCSDYRIFQKMLQEHGDDIKDHKRRKHDTQSCQNGTCHASYLVAHIGGTVDGDRTGRGFGHHGQIHHLILRQPLLFFHAGIGDHGDHSVSAAKGKQSDFHKTEKELRKDSLLLRHFAVPPMRLCL